MTAPDLYKVQARLGGYVRTDGLVWRGPGPGHSRRDASLKVDILPDGRALICSFAGDSFAECLAHLRIETGGAEYADRATFERRRQERERESRQRASLLAAFCEGVVAGCIPPEGTLVETYLNRHRSVTLGDDLLFHPCAPFSYEGGGRGPAMVAIARSVAGAAKGLHVTHLRPDGSKLRRTCFGALVGAAVRLQPAQDVLAVAEGVETALAFAELHTVPTWAALSTSGLIAFSPPTSVRCLVIAADADDHGAGMEAAHSLAVRLRARCDVTIQPAPAGMDWNDVLKAVGR